MPGRVFSSEHDLVEQSVKQWTAINEGVVLSFADHVGVYSCHVRDATDDGAGVRLNGLTILPFTFGISLDKFPHDTPVSADLARQRLRRLGIRSLTGNRHHLTERFAGR